MKPHLRSESGEGRQAGEGGAVLVLLALLLVGIFGVLGVVIDCGRLRSVQQQMLAGAETAALEGLRFKDTVGDGERRDLALLALERQWDDDLDVDNGDAIGLGAGAQPIVTGASPLGGLTELDPVGAGRFWKPGPGAARNAVNAAHGDLVAGQFLPNGLGREDDSFSRDDFLPSPTGSAANALASAPAFLVRLRRATERLDLDRQDGVSSAGPAFEWLWSRGSAWQEPDPTDPGDPRHSRTDGLTVRATSIASTERALLVSDDPTGATTLGTIALVGAAGSAWDGTSPGASLALDVDATGLLTVAGVEQGVALLTAARIVGESLAPASTPPAGLASGPLSISVYGVIAGERRVVGFTLGLASISGATLTVTRLSGRVLPSSASSVSPAALDARVALAQSPELRALHTSFTEPVLAPVISR